MSERRKDFLVNLVLGGVLAVAVFALGISYEYDLLRCICDGFFVSGALLLCMGGLKGVRNRGAFDVMGYGVSYTAHVFLPFLGNGEREDIQAYIERKTEKRKPARGLLLAGVVYLLLSFAALAVYYIA